MKKKKTNQIFTIKNKYVPSHIQQIESHKILKKRYIYIYNLTYIFRLHP